MLSNVFIVKRTISIRQYIPQFSVQFLLNRRQIFFIIFFLMFCDIPHLQKHDRKILYRISLDHDRCIFPMSKPFFLINIFICQIDSACKCRMSIDHADFAMISVILVRGKNWLDRTKHFAFDSFFLKCLRIMIRQKRNTAHPIIHKSDFHPFFHLFFQDFQDAIPHNSLFYDKVFHENEFLCLSKFRFQLLKLIFPQREIFDTCVPLNRISCLPRHIMCQICVGWFGYSKIFYNLLILLHIWLCLKREILEPFPDKPCSNLHTGKQIK